MTENYTIRVLVVDDLEINYKIMSKALEPEFTAEFAQSGQAALDKLATEDLPALILLDIMMPDMDGYDVCQTLKSFHRTRNIPVILITAQDDVSNRLRKKMGLMVGAMDVITKPIRAVSLRQRIMHILLRQREQDLLRMQETLRQYGCYDQITGLPQCPLQRCEDTLDLGHCRPPHAIEPS